MGLLGTRVEIGPGENLVKYCSPEGLPECDSWKACVEVGHGQCAFLTGSSNSSSWRPLMSKV